MDAAECDREAEELVTSYARCGEFSIVIRTLSNGSVRLIYASAPPERVACLLQEASDIVFDGP